MVYGITGIDEIEIKQFDPLFVKIIIYIFLFIIIYYASLFIN